MRKPLATLRGLCNFLSVLSLVASSLLVTSAAAQVVIPAGAVASKQGLANVFQKGQELERDGRWAEALTHYEDALRDFPNEKDLERKLSLSKIHYDLARRYSDSSFVASLKQMDERRSLDVYTEVLLKIQAHYVHGPKWQEIVRRGTSHIDVALTEPDFLARHLPKADPGRVASVRQELHRILDTRSVASRNNARELVAWAGRYVQHHLGVPNQVVIMEYTCAALGALDMYSSFLTRDQLDDVMSQIEGNFVGMGVELKSDDNALLIVNVIPNGPAHRAGIRSGDHIVEVDGRTTSDVSTDAAADMLKGIEGSSVDLVVVSADDTRRRMRVRRERVEVPSVEDIKIIDKTSGIGYMRLTSFQKTTTRDFEAALWKLHGQGMKSLIVDVRGNPGGLLTASVEVADKFVSSGTIVSTRGRSPREDYDYKAHVAGTWRVPLVVLIDGNSASASEIFAAAIHDHRRGTLIGERSFGKGSVQGIFPLNISKAGVRLTTAKFYSPTGTPISNRGVHPDVAVRVTAKPIDGVKATEEVDNVLNAGIQYARQKLVSKR